jgi:hypothetical protein
MRHAGGAAMSKNEKANRTQVILLGTEAIVQIPNSLPDRVKKANGLQRRVAGFHGSFYNCLNF